MPASASEEPCPHCPLPRSPQRRYSGAARSASAVVAAVALLALLCLPCAVEAAYRYECTPLVQGEMCTGEWDVCDAASIETCAACCERHSAAGCCAWLGNETRIEPLTATRVINATYTATATPTNASDIPTATVSNNTGYPVDTTQCRFYRGVTSTYGGHPMGWSRACSRVTATETATRSPTATLSGTPQEADETCIGHSFIPGEVGVGWNFTLTLFCRRGVFGERVFFTQTLGECRPGDAILLGEDGGSTHAEMDGSDTLGHPRYPVPPILQAADYQVCLETISGHTHALPSPLLRVRNPGVAPYVRLQKGLPGAGLAFNLTVEGFGLRGTHLALSTSKFCDASHIIWESSAVSRDLHHDLSQFAASGDGASCFLSEGSDAAMSVQHLSEAGRYYSCFRAYPDQDWVAHASFQVERPRLNRASVTPKVLYENTEFRLTLFGNGLTNLSRSDNPNITAESRCKVIHTGESWNDVDASEAYTHGGRCMLEGVEAASISDIEGNLVCLFPEGVPEGGWYYACIGEYNSSLPISDKERYPTALGGATFNVRTLQRISGSVVPSHPEAKSFFSVVVSNNVNNHNGLLEGAFVRVVDNPHCASPEDNDNSTLLTPNNEVRVVLWRGLPLLAPKWASGATACLPASTGALEFPPAGEGHGSPHALHPCPVEKAGIEDTDLLLICSGNATAAFTGAVFTLLKEECLEIGGTFHPGSRKCDVSFCGVRYDVQSCPGPRCSVLSGYALMGIGHCLKDSLFRARVGVVSTAAACGQMHGRYDRGRCLLDVCDAAGLPSNWHEVHTADHQPVFVSEPLVISRPAYPVSICLKNKYESVWRWIGAFGVDDSCAVKRAKYCRYTTCGGHLSPGPCRLSGVESRSIERTGHASYTSYRIEGERSAQTGVGWGGGGGVAHGPGNFLQAMCARMACHPRSPYGGVQADHMPVRFEKLAPWHRHPAFAISPDGLEARLMHSDTAFRVELGEEVHALTTLLPLEEGSELTFAFVVYGIVPSTVRIGFVGNQSASDDSFIGAYYNSSATPLQFGASLNDSDSSPCLLASGHWYRVVAKLHPSEISVWPDQESDEIHSYAACHLLRKTDFDLFHDIGWRFAFVVSSTNPSFIPESNRGRIRLRP